MATSYVRAAHARGLSVFDNAWVEERIASTRFARLHYAAETGSTNDDAFALLGDPAALGTVIVAGVQRTGRGRRGRRWVAPAGSALLFTAILPRAVAAPSLWAVPFWCAFGVRAGVLAASGIALDLQWPNDLLLDGAKACGILGVSRITGNEAWVGCGVGLNVVRPAPGADADPAAAYLSDTGIEIARELALVEILRAFDAYLNLLDKPNVVARAWERIAGLPGVPYRILEDDGVQADVVALRLAADGGLVVRDGDRERTIALADARVLR